MGVDPNTLSQLATALATDMTIDIVTTGARSGQPRSTEIWFMNISGRIIICGTPGTTSQVGAYTPRDWMANLRSNPDFEFCLKESVQHRLTARAAEVTDLDDRRHIMSAPETEWYRQQGCTLEELALNAPIVEVSFTGVYEALNRTI